MGERESRQFHWTNLGNERLYKKYRDLGVISEDDEALIKEYIAEHESSKNIGGDRKHKIISSLVNWGRFLHMPYRSLTITEIYAAISRLKEYRDPKRGLPYRQNTLHDYVVSLKPFLYWLDENGYNSLPIKNPEDSAAEYRHGVYFSRWDPDEG
ncbi:hypothetical protein [Methanosphaerula subterraneus]|uniref:hypothetical protein n=1 Tax=Methanosphaerula subterraneus TaxID=3350244 RepID=UPI003F83554C